MANSMTGASIQEEGFYQELRDCNGDVGAAQALLRLKLDNKIEIPLTLRSEIGWQLGIQDNSGANKVLDYWGDAKIRLLDTQTVNGDLGMSSVETDFVSGSQLGCDFLLFGVGFELTGEDMIFTLPGNAISTAATKGVSPDRWLTADAASDGTGKLDPGIMPATFDYGGCTWRAAEAIADGYAMTMLVQQTVPLFGGPHGRPLSDFASCGLPQTREGVSSSNVSATRYAQLCNDHYNNLPAGNPFGRNFVPFNAVRQGHTLASTTASPASAFSPASDSGLLVPASFGGKGKHPLYTNEVWKPFLTPVLLKQGTPFNVYLEAYSEALADAARRIMGTTDGGQQTIDASGVNASVGFGTPLAQGGPFTEVNEFAAADVTGLKVENRSINYKLGKLKMRTCFYGYQIIPDGLTDILHGVAGIAPHPGSGVHGAGSPQALRVLGNRR